MIAFLYACEQGDSSELTTETRETTHVQDTCSHQARIQ